MKKAIRATYCLKIFTNKKPQHVCYRDRILDLNDERATESLDTCKHSLPLYDDAKNILNRIYEELSSDNLFIGFELRYG